MTANPPLKCPHCGAENFASRLACIECDFALTTPAARSGFGFTHNYGRSEPVRQIDPTRDMSEESKPAEAREWFALRNTRTNQLTITFSTQKELDEHFNYHYWNNQDSRERVHVIEKSAYDALHELSEYRLKEFHRKCGEHRDALKRERALKAELAEIHGEAQSYAIELVKLRRELSEAWAHRKEYIALVNQLKRIHEERDAARAEVERLQNHIRIPTLQALEAERDRYKAALERIARENFMLKCKCAEKAREALGEGKGDT